MPKYTHDQVAIVVTARFNSSRLFHKPLIEINGVSLVQSVVNECLKIDKVKTRIVTSESAEVLDSISGDIHKVLTSDAPHSGSERLAEVGRNISAQVYALVPCDIWPLQVSVIENFIDTMLQTDSTYGTLTGNLLNEHELFDPTIVKSLLDKDSNALWFSRIPFLIGTSFTPALGQYVKKQLGMYWYTDISLKAFNELPMTPCEQAESNESLRILQNSNKMQCYTTDVHIECINTEQDIERVHSKWKAQISMPVPAAGSLQASFKLFKLPATSQLMEDQHTDAHTLPSSSYNQSTRLQNRSLT
jgi:CMP-2-keto-3-deoxyoctulosonic acid synthetase